MKKLTTIKKGRGNKSLYGTFLYMTLLPLFLFGLVMIIYSSNTLIDGIQSETINNLHNLGISVLASYDAMYPGDYRVELTSNTVTFYKGEKQLDGDYMVIDQIKDKTNVEISMFFSDTRMLTTITDKDNKRYINTGANRQIVEQVMTTGTAQFFNNAEINHERYFAYYEPIFTHDKSTCIGMLATAKPAAEIEKTVQSAVYKNIMIMVLALLITALFIVRFASNIVMVIKKMMDFLKDISSGNLDAELNPIVADRGDELGEMGRFTIRVQASLRKLIERDVLTGLYNRRSAEHKLDEIRQKGETYSIAIADIDFFKQFNDNYGHECGDIVLKEVARLLNDGMRNFGYAARWGGEEFLLLFENMGRLAAGIEADRILQTIRENCVNYNGNTHKVTLTIGISEGTADTPVNAQIKEADDKLYQGKESGRNRIVV